MARRSKPLIVVTQHQEWDCGIAALASLLNVPYGDVSASARRLLDGKQKNGLRIRHMEAIAKDLGFTLRRVYRRKDYLVGTTGILGLVGTGFHGDGHYVLLTGGHIIDTDKKTMRVAVSDALDYMKAYGARPCTLLCLDTRST